MKDYIGKMVRQRRPKDKNGKCRDTARVTVVKDGVKKVYSLGRWDSSEAHKAYKKLQADFYADTLDIAPDTTDLATFFVHYWERAEPLKSDPGRYRTKKVLKWATELCGATSGLMFRIQYTRVIANYGEVFAIIGVMIVIFATLTAIMFAFRNWLLRWQKGLARW